MKPVLATSAILAFVFGAATLITEDRESQQLAHSRYLRPIRELKGELILIATIGRYPGLPALWKRSTSTVGPLLKQMVDPRGTVKVIFHGSSFMVQADLTGLQDACEECGIHIHQGTSCEEASEVGGHYWNDTALSIDPWWAHEKGAVYSVGANRATMPGHSFSLYSGYGFESNNGHAVVVHGDDGTRIGCGILENNAEAKKLEEVAAVPVAAEDAITEDEAEASATEENIIAEGGATVTAADESARIAEEEAAASAAAELARIAEEEAAAAKAAELARIAEEEAAAAKVAEEARIAEEADATSLQVESVSVVDNST